MDVFVMPFLDGFYWQDTECHAGKVVADVLPAECVPEFFVERAFFPDLFVEELLELVEIVKRLNEYAGCFWVEVSAFVLVEGGPSSQFFFLCVNGSFECRIACVDFEEMAKRALGSHWRRRNPKEQQEFVRLFSDLLENAYISRIEAYNNEKLVYTGEKLDGQYAEVQSRMATSKGEEYSINYKVRLVNSQWKVYDVVIENISLVNNYRSQFNRVITKSSYEDLILRLKEKQTETQ